MEDLVSIIMPSYNTEKYIKKSIASVIKQTYQNWELIIVDDCSTDNTDDIIKKFDDVRIRYIKNKRNFGAAISRNRALRLAKGRWIAFLDSDDLWKVQKLEKQLKFMKDYGYSFTFTDYRTQLNGKWLPYINSGPSIVTRRKLYNYCYIFTSTVIYDREKIGLIQIENIKKNNDYAMWFQAIEKANFYRFPECLSFYIKHENSISSGNKLKLIKYHYIMFRKALHKRVIVSFSLTINNLVHGIIKKFRYKRKLDKEN